MENEPHADKTRGGSRMKMLMLVAGVIALGVMMALSERNQRQCGCSLFGSD